MHVIIVGAGPCGFSLSLVLARAGIKVTLIEKGKTVDSQPRAAHLMAPGIQMLRRAGVLEDVRHAGFMPKNLAWRRLDGTNIVTIYDISASKSPDAMTVLPIGHLGQIMLSYAERNPKITIKWGREVVDVGQDENSAWALAKDSSETSHKISADYLVGCDGGTSQVRRSLFGARNFPGKTWPVQLVATNVYYPFDNHGYDDMNTILDPHESHIVARLTPDGLWRVAYPEPSSMSAADVLANQAAHYARILPGHPGPDQYTLTHINPYRMHQRCAEKFRVGRICLAGDAAHLCNPWGGLGLTGGFADVGGLAECLEGIASGRADEGILEKYDEVRRRIWRDVIDPVSTGNLERVSTVDPLGAPQNDEFLAMCVRAEHDSGVKEMIEKSVYGICHDFTQYYSRGAR